jgi:RHS repeat-associated protein
LSSTGSGASVFGFDAEQTDSYIKLINLRSRLYSPETGRFLTKDTWQGNYNRSLSLNRWIYVEDNSNNFVDPLGMAKRSCLFYFDGAGNTGNDTIGKPQNNFLSRLNEALHFQVKIVPIFPYGTSLSGEDMFSNVKDVVEPAANGRDAGVTTAKANQIWNYVVFGKEIAETVNLWGNCSFQGHANRSEVKLNF